MGRPDVARGGNRGGEDVQALRQARTRIAAGTGAFACAVGLATLALARAEEDAFVSSGLRVAIVALLALVAALVRGWAPLLPASLVLLGGLYGAELALDDAQVDIAVPLVATGLVLVAELGYWSLEEQERVQGEPGDSLRRVAFVALLALGTLIVTASLLAVVDAIRASGLTLDLLGAAAAATALVAIVLAARDLARTDA